MTMTKTGSATAANVRQAVQALHDQLETIRNTDPQSLANMEVGDEWRQGDLRIIRLPDDFVKASEAKLQETQPRLQLAPGSTQGSRHCLDSLDGVRMFLLRDATPLDGPVILVERPFRVNHPEHGDCVDIPPGCYGFPGQRAYADELRRVVD